MADNDQSLYTLRYNQVTSGIEGFGGGSPQWTPLTLTNSDPNVVASLHADSSPNLMGDVQLVSGTSITLSQVGQVITIDSTAVSSPAGSDTQIQFNNSGAFGASANFTWDGTAINIGGAAPTVNFLDTGTPTASMVKTLGGSLQITNTDGDANIAGNSVVVQSSTLAQRNDAGGEFILGDSLGSLVYFALDADSNGAKMYNDVGLFVFGQGPSAPILEPSAAVAIQSSDKGFLPPVLGTAQKTSISSPAEGLVVYDTDLHKLCVFTGTVWETVTSV